MNFFALQEHARRRTGQLIVYYGIAVALIIVVIYLVLGFAFGRFVTKEEAGVTTLWMPDLFFFTAVAVIVIIGCGTLYQVSALSSGGAGGSIEEAKPLVRLPPVEAFDAGPMPPAGSPISITCGCRCRPPANGRT